MSQCKTDKCFQMVALALLEADLGKGHGDVLKQQVFQDASGATSLVLMPEGEEESDSFRLLLGELRHEHTSIGACWKDECELSAAG